MINPGLRFLKIKTYLFGTEGVAVSDYFAETLLVAYHFTTYKTRLKKIDKLLIRAGNSFLTLHN